MPSFPRYRNMKRRESATTSTAPDNKPANFGSAFGDRQVEFWRLVLVYCELIRTCCALWYLKTLTNFEAVISVWILFLSLLSLLHIEDAVWLSE